jgi:CHAT domain-containing protein/tetratricopeptide (TPR) repeat protein
MRSRSRRRAAALLAAGLLLAACERSPPAGKPAAALPAPRAAPARPAAARLLRLAPGALDAVTLKGGEERDYLLDLAAGWYAGLVVDQQGIDVEVSLRAPDGRFVAAIDSLNGMIGPEPLPVAAETGGRFRLEVRSLTAGAPAGRYVLRLEELRPASARDRARVGAEQALAAGMRLYQEGTPASLPAALAREKEALARFHALGLPAREAEALSCLGAYHDRLHEREAAADFYRQALAIFDGLGDEARVGPTLSNLAKLERINGRPERAIALYRRAIPLLHRSHNWTEEAMNLSNLGRAAMEVGETGEALSAFEQALSRERSLGDRFAQGNTLSNLGLLESNLGQTSLALDHLGQAVALQEADGDRRGLGVTLARMGVARALGGHSRQEVLATFQRALQLQRETGDRSWEAVTRHNLGWYLHREGESQQAERILRETLAFFQEHGERVSEAGALVNLGFVDLDLGRLAEAEESFLRAQALFAEIGDPDKKANALFGLARALRAAGRTASALTAIEGASTHIEALRRKPIDLNLRMTFFASKQDIYELRVDLLMELHRRDPRAGFDARALMASEEARARTLLDLLEKAHVGAGSGGARLTAAPTPGFREIQRQVAEPGALVLEYYLGRERSFLWAVTPGAIESFELPPRGVLEAEARRAAFLLAASNQALAHQQAEFALADLSHRLLAPVAHLLRGAERLVIVPDGALWYISFAALPDPGAGGPAGAGPPLVVGHEIVTLPSLSVLPRLRRDAAGRRPAPGAVAILADPVFDAMDSRVMPIPMVAGETSVLRGDRGARLARLPFSRAEAQAILSVAPRQGTLAALDFDASRETVLSGRLAQYRIVHFATHAVLNTENPELSGVMLSMVDPQGRPRDGFLRLSDIYRLHLPADLVVLSACRTALGREIRGEGMIGLTRGFFSAGAREVLVSLWPVEDRATAELMRRFYREVFSRGRPAAAALREAQTAMWRDEGWRSAYYWAGFSLQGDWRDSR